MNVKKDFRDAKLRCVRCGKEEEKELVKFHSVLVCFNCLDINEKQELLIAQRNEIKEMIQKNPALYIMVRGLIDNLFRDAINNL